VRSALFLDRDGVINVDHGYVHTAEQTVFIDGIFTLCATARAAGFNLIVVTNQAGIARGLYLESAFIDYTRWMHEQFAFRNAPLLATYFCPHHPSFGPGNDRRDCSFRKPGAGMLLRARADFGIDMGQSLLIGDKDSDLAAATAAGVGAALQIGKRGLGEACGWIKYRTGRQS
jgi:D-glycero-D-manno-heptose 1,7-bisphosphate phosphatase